MKPFRYEVYSNGTLLSYYEIYNDNGTIKWTNGSTTRNATASEIQAYNDFNTPQDAPLMRSDVVDSLPMVDSSDKIPSESQVMRSDAGIYNATRNRAWVTGILKNDTFVYFSKSVTMGGAVTFYLTDNGGSTGNAVYKNIYADTITITAYGAAAAYQILSPTVSADKKSITAQVTQTTAVLLGALQFTTAANNIDCRLLVLGD